MNDKVRARVVTLIIKQHSILKFLKPSIKSWSRKERMNAIVRSS